MKSTILVLLNIVMIVPAGHRCVAKSHRSDPRRTGAMPRGIPMLCVCEEQLVVGGLEHFYFPIYWESSSQLTFIFFRGVGSTTNQIAIFNSYVTVITRGYTKNISWMNSAHLWCRHHLDVYVFHGGRGVHQRRQERTWRFQPFGVKSY